MALPTRKQNRLTEYDYSTPNAYFITVCTEKRKNLFWTNVGAGIGQSDNPPLSTYGNIADACIRSIPVHYPSITVDNHVIMPNHIHLLLQIHLDSDGRPMAAPTISTVVNQTKGIISKQIGFPVWQKGFYDHVIRNDRDYQEIWKYIDDNPRKWEDDHLFNPSL